VTAPLTIEEAARALRAGATTSTELTEECIAQADRLDKKLGTYLVRCDDVARRDAARADDELAAGRDRGPLHGIPLAVKDILATDDCPTTAQSLVLDPTWGDQGDAVAVARLRAAGAVITGKTSTMEFAIGLPDASKPFPVPRNPWNTDLWSGGSSSGTANGVAAGLFFGGIGTDTGGSIRMPAAVCGVSGIKPTFGRVPKSGCVPLSWTLDHVGPVARTARDCALMLNAMAGYDASDPLCVDVPVPDFTAKLDGSLAGTRIGVQRRHLVDAPFVDASVIAAFEEAVAALAEGGAEVVEVEIPHYDLLDEACPVIIFSEAFAYHRRSLATRWHDFGDKTRVMVASGALYSGADYVQAQRVRRYVREQVDTILEGVDVIVTPTVGAAAPAVEGLDFLAALTLPIFTPVWNALGLPAMSVPSGFGASSMPAGLQIAGRHLGEATVLRVGDAYQQLTKWHLEVPPLAGQIVSNVQAPTPGAP
jgi:aspartyl-tRNA(Asn)/glutamyl-tRNA(Gln) amidotransferase subunit A